MCERTYIYIYIHTHTLFRTPILAHAQRHTLFVCSHRAFILHVYNTGFLQNIHAQHACSPSQAFRILFLNNPSAFRMSTSTYHKRSILACMCMYTFVYKCVYIFSCIDIYIYICTHVYIHLYMYIYIYIHIHIRIFSCTHVCAHVSVYAHTFHSYIHSTPSFGMHSNARYKQSVSWTETHIYTYVCMHVCTYICMYVYIYVRRCTYIFRDTCIHTYVHLYIYIYIYTYIHIPLACVYER